MSMQPCRTGLVVAVSVLASLPGWLPRASAHHVPAHQAPTSDSEMIANALAAAPDSIAGEAAVVAIGPDGAVRRLHEGRGAFTCVPDDPATPANDPICLDANGLAWLTAWITRAPPPIGRIGVGYRMQGGSTPSNVEPFAAEPPAGAGWRQEPPQVMILNLPPAPGDQPPAGPQPDMAKPWMRWSGSPYAHLVVPLV
jgi:hypothetical protein